MEDHESQGLDSLTETMNAAHLQVSGSEREEICLLNTKKSPLTDEGPSLTNLAGELQNIIVNKLHPSAAIALSQTSRHFHACVNLHRLPFSEVFKWLQEKEQLSTISGDYACYICLRLKPRSGFAKGQTRTPRGKSGHNARARICLDCGFSTGMHTPGSMIKIGGELQVLCMGCENSRKRFCMSCRWCDSCIGKGTATVLRKGRRAGPDGEAREVIIRNSCSHHVWEKPKPVRSGAIPQVRPSTGQNPTSSHQVSLISSMYYHPAFLQLADRRVARHWINLARPATVQQLTVPPTV